VKIEKKDKYYILLSTQSGLLSGDGLPADGVGCKSSFQRQFWTGWAITCGQVALAFCNLFCF